MAELDSVSTSRGRARSIAVIVALAATLAAGTATAAHAETFAPLNNTGDRLEFYVNSAYGDPAHLFHNKNTSNQSWTPSSEDSLGFVTLNNDYFASGSACLDDYNSQTDNGNKIQVWSCNGTKAQRWAAPYVNGNTFQLGVEVGAGGFKDPNHCANDWNGDTNDGAVVKLFTCNGNNRDNLWQ
jgi:hypothetical protein